MRCTSVYSQECKKCKEEFSSSRKRIYCNICVSNHRCKTCGKQFNDIASASCSRECTKKSGRSKTRKSYICILCNSQFESADSKAKYCGECKKPRSCLCGCGVLVKTPGYSYSFGCTHRGRTYKEIYGTERPTVGFQLGENNVNQRPEVQKKLSDAVKESYTPELRDLRSRQQVENLKTGLQFACNKTNKYGKYFRSSLEVQFSELLEDNQIVYDYEYTIDLLENSYGYRRKLVDFVVNDVLIEITGSAFKEWIQETLTKIEVLEESTYQKILVLTYSDKVETLSSLNSTRVQVLDFFTIINDIQLFKGLVNL